jgi:hypothetical protein
MEFGLILGILMKTSALLPVFSCNSDIVKAAADNYAPNTLCTYYSNAGI